MSVASVTTSASVTPPAPPDSKPPQTSADTDDTPAYQPPAPSPLPPGQGTRIDQIA